MYFVNIIRRICDTFNRNSVEYLLIGGTAMALHGYYRHTKTVDGAVVEKPDLDFWYRKTYTNYYNVLKALEELGLEVTQYKAEQSVDLDKAFFRFELNDYTLDLLPEINLASKFWQATSRREVFGSGGVDIPFMGIEDLIENKKRIGRPKDIEDVENLQRLNDGV